MCAGSSWTQNKYDDARLFKHLRSDTEDLNSDQDSDRSPNPDAVSEPSSGSDSDPDSEPLVPGPGFVLVVSDSEVRVFCWSLFTVSLVAQLRPADGDRVWVEPRDCDAN